MRDGVCVRAVPSPLLRGQLAPAGAQGKQGTRRSRPWGKMSSPAIGRSEAQPRGCKDTRPLRPASPRLLWLFQSRPPGRDAPPPFRLQNGGEGTRCPRTQKFFVPFQVREAWRPAWPARPCRPGKPAKQKGAGRHRLGLLGPPPPAPRIPRHPRAPATTYRASDASDVLTGPAAAPTALTTPCGVPETGVPVRDRGPRERPRALWGGTEHRPRPLYPPLLHAKPVPWRSATNPNLHFGVSTSARPGRAIRAHLLCRLGL